MRSKWRRQHGFTAVEVMVVIAILAILAAFAAPAMTKLLATQKVRSLAYDLFADLTYARSEAIARGVTVNMTSLNGLNWLSGWTITETAGNSQLRQATNNVTGVSFTADQSTVSFERTGRTTAGTVSFTIIPTDTSATDDQKRCVRIDPSGRPRSTTGACT